MKHYYALLNAECLVLKGKRLAAMKEYESAILSRSGYQHDAAVDNERLGEFHLRVMDDPDEAAYYIRRSLMYWKDWGDIAKVGAMEEKYAYLINPKGGVQRQVLPQIVATSDEEMFHFSIVVIIQGMTKLLH